jgi:hypothetical protein
VLSDKLLDKTTAIIGPDDGEKIVAGSATNGLLKGVRCLQATVHPRNGRAHYSNTFKESVQKWLICDAPRQEPTMADRYLQGTALVECHADLRRA